MKLIYTDANRLLVNNAYNILQNRGIDVVLRNEFSGGAAGDLSPFDTWLEVWVKEEREFELAERILEETLSETDGPDWICPHCQEPNASTMDICWNCQKDRPETFS